MYQSFSYCAKSTNHDWYNCHFHIPNFFLFPFLFCGNLGKQSSQFCNFFFFLLFIIRSRLLAQIRCSVCMSKSHRSLCVLFSRTDAGLCRYHLFVWSNLNFLHIPQSIILPTQSCLVSYSYCANMLHLLIDGFVSITTTPTFAILLRHIFSRYGVVLCCY